MDNADRPARPTRLLLVLAAVLAVLLPGTPAWAHNALADATPAKNATVKKPPTTVKLRFLQKLDPDRTRITVTGEGEVTASKPKVDGVTGSITFEPLANGDYTVAYEVVSRDGHPVKGSYKFTVADPAASAPAPTSAAPTSAVAAPASAVAQTPVADEDAGSFPTVPVVIGALVLVLAAGGGLFLTRRRRNG